MMKAIWPKRIDNSLSIGPLEMAAKRAVNTAKSQRVFSQRQKPAKMFRLGLHARMSTDDYQAVDPLLRGYAEP
jgi:hypothetical protein